MLRQFILPAGVLACTLFSTAGCRDSHSSSTQQTASADRVEAREDSMELAAAYARQEKIKNAVHPTTETSSAHADVSDDAADDPAIWVDRTQPSHSLVIGTNKKGGLAVYDLRGAEIAYYPVGKTNNVDVLYGFDLNGRLVDIAGSTNRTKQSIDLFVIDGKNRSLTDISARTLKMDSTLIDDVYGFCFYHSTRSGKAYLFVNGKNGRLHQYQLKATKDNTIDLEQVRGMNFRSQTEGMVADSRTQRIYIGEENAGVWYMSAEPDASDEPVLIPMSGEENASIFYDVEGLSLYRRGEEAFLVVSSQGNFSYAVFSAGDQPQYLTSFKVTDTAQIDGSQETDGLDIVSDSLSPQYPRGLLVVQDGFNFDGETPAAQNFKYISWSALESILPRQ